MLRKSCIILGSLTIIPLLFFHILLINDEKIHAVVESQTSSSDASEWFFGLLIFSFLFLSPEHQFCCELISRVRGWEHPRYLTRPSPCTHPDSHLHITCCSPGPEGLLSPLPGTLSLDGCQPWMRPTVKLGLQGTPPGQIWKESVTRTAHVLVWGFNYILVLAENHAHF